ncbi:MAG: hypothetical protein JWP89_6867 [Schlesneria sp.]|nr:hypothetical protein [Schlesneria sp.]
MDGLSVDWNVMLRKPLFATLAEYDVDQFYVPLSWNHAAVLDGGTCYIVPPRLMTLVIERVGSGRFSTLALEREAELGQAAGSKWGNVAIHKGRYVQHYDLDYSNPLDTEATQDFGNRAQARLLARTSNARLQTVDVVRRGYLGWLLTRRAFLDEHDLLLTRHRTPIQQHGFPQPLRSSSDGLDISVAETAEWVADCHRFYSRWRLQSLAHPYLPYPLPFEIPTVQPAAAEDDSGILKASIPDIYTTPGRGPFHEMIEDAIRGTTAPENLHEWLAIVRSGNLGKKVIPMYERWFRLQHYWRLLHRRFPEPLRRKKTRLIEAFATFLNVNTDTIKLDLRKIEDLLGHEWQRRYVGLS